jgi:hypothetical protein
MVSCMLPRDAGLACPAPRAAESPENALPEKPAAAPGGLPIACRGRPRACPSRNDRHGGRSYRAPTRGASTMATGRSPSSQTHHAELSRGAISGALRSDLVVGLFTQVILEEHRP